jgi:hypothetical protein
MDDYCITISNKAYMEPSEEKPEPEYYEGSGWYRGYSFKQFWGNCYAMLGDIGKLEGIQQLCHHYYLQNGALSAKVTVGRIRKFLCT